MKNAKKDPGQTISFSANSVASNERMRMGERPGAEVLWCRLEMC
jgi:hypothetical protein